MLITTRKITGLATQLGHLRGTIMGTLLYDDNVTSYTFKNLSRELISVLDPENDYENGLIDQIKERAKKFDIKYVSES
jgi:hypothetical protein